jgi:uncharacterized membrane protein (DUF4010 family)
MTPADPQTWLQLGLALALGLFVGLEREQTGHRAGIRTFPLITLFGACAALVAEQVAGWILPAGLLGLAVSLVVPPSDSGLESDETDRNPWSGSPGTTTMVAAFVMYTVGAMLVMGYASVAVAIGGMTAVLLHWKRPLHSFVDQLGEAEYRAVYRFVLIAVVVLPVLPDQTYGPYDVLNPFRIWLIVVLIVGISVVGFLVYKYLGRRVGLVVGGVLGGVVSSTAATVSYARQSARVPTASHASAVAIMIASTLAFVRIVVEVVVVAPDLRWVVIPKFGVLIGVMVVVSLVAYWMTEAADDSETHQPEDPAALKAAFVFGGLYALILFAMAFVDQRYGETGMYAVAVVSGLTDVDAITLSTAEMMQGGRVSAETGWRMMMLAGLSNVVFKGGIAAVIGARELRARIAVLFGITLASGAGILWLWPTG